jgi:hypothetical protein
MKNPILFFASLTLPLYLNQLSKQHLGVYLGFSIQTNGLAKSRNHLWNLAILSQTLAKPFLKGNQAY